MFVQQTLDICAQLLKSYAMTGIQLGYQPTHYISPPTFITCACFIPLPLDRTNALLRMTKRFPLKIVQCFFNSVPCSRKSRINIQNVVTRISRVNGFMTFHTITTTHDVVTCVSRPLICCSKDKYEGGLV